MNNCIHKPQYRSVILYRDRLLYDINFESWKISQTRIDDKTVQMNISTDEEADMWLERQFDTAFGKIKENLQFCLDRFTAAGDTATNKLAMKEDTDAELEETEDDVYATAQQEGENTEESQDEEPTTTFRPHYTFGFKFSEYWRGNIEVIKNNIHNYVRCYTLSEWFSMVKPDEAPRYLQYADKYLSDMVRCARQEDMTGVSFRL